MAEQRNGDSDQDPLDTVPDPADELEGPAVENPLASRPSIEDLTVNMPGAAPHPFMWLVTGSDDPKEYALRGRMTRQEIADVIEIMADENEMVDGDPDMLGLIAFKFNASAGENDRARQDFLTASKGAAEAAKASMFGRFNQGAKGQFTQGDVQPPPVGPGQ